MIERLSAWWRRRRLAALDRRTKASENKDVAQLRREIADRTKRHSAAMGELAGKLKESERLRDEENKEYARLREESADEIERLNRLLSLAKIEIDGLTAIINRDRSRVDAEAMIFEKRARGLSGMMGETDLV